MGLHTTSAIAATVALTLLSSSAKAQYIHGPVPNHPIFIHGGIPWMFGAPLPVQGPIGHNKTFDSYEWPVYQAPVEPGDEWSEKELFFPDGFVPFLGAPSAPGTEPRFSPNEPSDDYCAIKECRTYGDPPSPPPTPQSPTPQPPTPQPPAPQPPTPQPPAPDSPQPPTPESFPNPDTPIDEPQGPFTPMFPDRDDDRPGTSDIVNVVPEPSTYALFGAGLLGLGVAARRRRK